jgi:4-hydroxybenzoate polyprenyltransferase
MSYLDDTRWVVHPLLAELRPKQWYKQSIILVAILFSGDLFVVEKQLQTIGAVIAFTAISGAIYIVNDISDIEEDRNHPVKQHRPIASGRLSVPVAALFAVLLGAGSMLLSYYIDLLLLATIVAYVAQNILYSFILKDILFIDVMILAIGFVLRAIAGVFAIDAVLSPWLIICTFLLALTLGLAKRRHELVETEDPQNVRSTLGEYSEDLIDQLTMIISTALLVSYSLYSFFAREGYAMLVTLPFAYFGVFRFHYLVFDRGEDPNPLNVLRDRQFVLNLVAWTATVVVLIYLVPPIL